MKTYVIAEAACTWLHEGLDGAKRSIELAKSCGASAWKTQWVSDYLLMHKQRGIEGDAYKRLAWPQDWLEKLKAICDSSGIGFLCTVFLCGDVKYVSSLVSNAKIAAFEYLQNDLIQAWLEVGKPVIQSLNPGVDYEAYPGVKYLYCISKYPTEPSALSLHRLRWGYSGFSDHTVSVLSGAIAVSLGMGIIEKHVRTYDTPKDDPDWGHSMILDSNNPKDSFREYVENIRKAEEMIG